MSFLSQVTSGIVQRPYFLLVVGTDGVGKTTFAANAPKPIFLGAEQGTDQLDIARLPTPSSYNQVFEMIEELRSAPHDYQTFVIDSVDWLEPLVWGAVVDQASKKDKEILSIEDMGYGKGYNKAVENWTKLLESLGRLRERMNVVLVGHSFIKKFEDPQTNSAYDRYVLKLHDKSAAKVREAVDAVLFATFEIFTHKDESKKLRAYGDGARVLYTERRPAFDAKNRYALPFQLPLSWQAFDEAARKGEPESSEAIRARIVGLLSAVTNKEIVKTVEAEIEKAKDNVKRLAQFENRLKQIVSAQEG